jgi:hypothetical protein
MGSLPAGAGQFIVGAILKLYEKDCGASVTREEIFN